ncbi:MAG: hypothetical protein JRF27_04325, partial [Deltaproteobacteria bacterium]|nr:hypothetical protein [Deltaproteobacteria bacterium]
YLPVFPDEAELNPIESEVAAAADLSPEEPEEPESPEEPELQPAEA